jgi:predicted small integral membrane protein
MTLRAAKLLLVAAVAVYHALVVLNNTTDYASNQ